MEMYNAPAPENCKYSIVMGLVQFETVNIGEPRELEERMAVWLE
jgi:hypothetical protein